MKLHLVNPTQVVEMNKKKLLTFLRSSTLFIFVQDIQITKHLLGPLWTKKQLIT